MKKLMIAVAIVCTMFALPACGKNADNKIRTVKNCTSDLCMHTFDAHLKHI